MQAACKGTASALTVDVGTLSVATGQAVAVGSVLKTVEGAWTSFGANSSGTCGAQTLISYPAIGTLSSQSSNVYDTNLLGIGIRISVWTKNAITIGVGGGYYGMPTTPTPIPYVLPLQSITTGYFGAGYNEIRVEIIRTATNWQGGELLVTGPLLMVSDQSGNAGPFTVTTLTVKGTSALRTCSVTTPHLIVDLGTVRMPDVVFSTPAATRAFTIDMSCSSNTQVAIQFDGAAVAGNQQVLQLRDAPNVAQGIGVQILDPTGKPVTIGQSVPLINATSTPQSQFNFGARYVPISPHRTPGTADSNATFTMEYN